MFDVKIVVPAGSIRPFHYSDMEISPTRNHIILSSGEGLGDTEVVLKTIEVTEENAYEPICMTPGLAVKMEAERGAWFRIGVAISNPTDEDITVYVHVENVTVRIADPNAASNETGLEGRIMSLVCETLLQTKGQLPLYGAMLKKKCIET